MTGLFGKNEFAAPLRSLRILPLLLSFTISCSGSVEPRSGVTLLVSNASCHGGRCDSLRILAFPSNQPNTPGGLWSLDLGLVTAPEVCLVLPPSATFHVTGVRENGTTDTTTYAWTSAKSLSLGALLASSSRIQAGPTISPFVPATAAGWRITVPTGSQASPSSACKP